MKVYNTNLVLLYNSVSNTLYSSCTDIYIKIDDRKVSVVILDRFISLKGGSFDINKLFFFILVLVYKNLNRSLQ